MHYYTLLRLIWNRTSSVVLDWAYSELFSEGPGERNYQWWHNLMLRAIADAICAGIVCSKQVQPTRTATGFVKDGGKPQQHPRSSMGLLATAQDRKLKVDLRGKPRNHCRDQPGQTWSWCARCTDTREHWLPSGQWEKTGWHKHTSCVWVALCVRHPQSPVPLQWHDTLLWIARQALILSISCNAFKTNPVCSASHWLQSPSRFSFLASYFLPRTANSVST